MKSHRIIAAAATLALAATPVAFAKSGENHGKGTEKSALKGQNGKGHAKGKNAVLKGTVVSVDLTTGVVTVDVTKATKHGKVLIGTNAFTATKVNVADTNADGVMNTLDMVAGDKVVIQLRLKADSASPYAARKIVDQTNPKPEEAEEAEEAPVVPAA